MISMKIMWLVLHRKNAASGYEKTDVTVDPSWPVGTKDKT